LLRLSADPEDASRKKNRRGGNATAYLEQFDNPDSGVQARVQQHDGQALSLAPRLL